MPKFDLRYYSMTNRNGFAVVLIFINIYKTSTGTNFIACWKLSFKTMGCQLQCLCDNDLVSNIVHLLKEYIKYA